MIENFKSSFWAPNTAQKDLTLLSETHPWRHKLMITPRNNLNIDGMHSGVSYK